MKIGATDVCGFCDTVTLCNHLLNVSHRYAHEEQKDSGSFFLIILGSVGAKATCHIAMHTKNEQAAFCFFLSAAVASNAKDDMAHRYAH